MNRCGREREEGREGKQRRKKKGRGRGGWGWGVKGYLGGEGPELDVSGVLDVAGVAVLPGRARHRQPGEGHSCTTNSTRGAGRYCAGHWPEQRKAAGGIVRAAPLLRDPCVLVCVDKEVEGA